MPTFYFHVYNDDVTLDDLGLELADEQAAYAHAIKEARVLAADTVRHGHFSGDDRIEIVDQDRKLVATVRYDQAVDIRLPRDRPVAGTF